MENMFHRCFETLLKEHKMNFLPNQNRDANLAQSCRRLAFQSNYREILGLGLDHLIGTSLLRAYMHGYFMDARLYRKAHSVAAPYTLDKFMRDKINGKLAEERSKRVQHKTEKLPKTNKDLFLKLKENEENGVKKKHREAAANLLKDDRFSAMFTNENFQVDQNDQAFKLLNPVLTKLDAKKVRSFFS